MNSRFTSSVAGASIFITITGLISKGLGFFREIIFASLFGLTPEFDLYLVAAVLPLTLNTIILYLAQNYLIPVYNRTHKIDPNTGLSFIESNFVIFFLGGFFISLFFFFFSYPIMELYLKGHNPLLIVTAVHIFRIFLISLPINCAISVLSAYQQVNFEFRYPAYSQLLLNIVFILIILVLSKKLSVFAIPWGYSISILLQLIYLLKKSEFSLKITNLNYLFKNYKKYVPSTLFTIILIESISQLYVVSDRYFYNQIPTGGLAALNYSQIVFLLPLSVLSMAMSTAIFPRFAQCIQNKENSELENVFNESIKINVAIFIPITFLFLFYGDTIIRLLFQRGKFSSTDTLITGSALIFFSISLVFYATYTVLNKLIYSMGMINNLFIITVAGIIIKIISNFLLVNYFHQNGLALSTTLSYLFFFFYSLLLIYRQITFKNKKIFFAEMLFHLTNGTISLLIVKQMSFLFPQRESLLEIALFLVLLLVNTYLIKHSLIKIVDRLLTAKKQNYRQ